MRQLFAPNKYKGSDNPHVHNLPRTKWNTGKVRKELVQQVEHGAVAEGPDSSPQEVVQTKAPSLHGHVVAANTKN